MHAECVGGWGKGFNGVAVPTFAAMHAGAQLPVVRVFMAVQATRMTRVVIHIRAFARMAAGALHAAVHPKQWIGSLLMVFQIKRRRSVTIHRVAAAAIALVCPGGKLIPVLILVAIETKRVRYLRAEVALFVTFTTLKGGMLSP